MAEGVTGPIGVFDSGLGGLSLVQALQEKLPHESILYFADLKHLPYGAKTDEEVTQYSLEIGRYLQERGAKVLLIACSTASAVAGDLLAKELELPVVTVMNNAFREDILEKTQTGHVAVISTPLTVQSGTFARWIQEGNRQVSVHSVASLPLVNKISEGKLEPEGISKLIDEALTSVLELHPVDQVVLGCTHFNFVEKIFETVLPAHIQVASAPKPAAQYVAQLLKQNGVEADRQMKGQIEIVVSEMEPVFVQFVEKLFSIQPEQFTLFTKEPV